MNHSAEIAAFVLARGGAVLEDIGDQVDVEESMVKHLVGRLQAQGILKRVGDRVLIEDKARAQTLALQADGDYTQRPGAHRIEPPATPKVESPAAAPAKPGPKERIPLCVTVELKTGVPLPPPRMGRTSPPCPWPLAAMEIGQMFEVAVPAGYEATDVANQVRKDIKTFDRLNPGRFFTVRTFLTDDEVLIVGVWREASQPARGAHLRHATAQQVAVPPAPAPVTRLVQPNGTRKVGRPRKAAA